MEPRPSLTAFLDTTEAWLDAASDDKFPVPINLVPKEQVRRGLTLGIPGGALDPP